MAMNTVKRNPAKSVTLQVWETKVVNAKGRVKCRQKTPYVSDNTFVTKTIAHKKNIEGQCINPAK